VCSRECSVAREAYERGREEERAAIVQEIKFAISGLSMSARPNNIARVEPMIAILSSVLERMEKGKHEVKR
jgi:hypothetical protein